MKSKENRTANEKETEAPLENQNIQKLKKRKNYLYIVLFYWRLSELLPLIEEGDFLLSFC